MMATARRTTFATLLFIGAASPALAAPPTWTVTKPQSQVGFSGTQSGAAFKGVFGQWDAAIAFDPKDLAHSSAKVTIAVGSAKIGDALQDSSLAQEEWLNPAGFPRATFVTSQINSAGPNRYVAKGVLTLKGKALPATLNFTLAIQGDTATMRGQANVDRIAYGIGTKSDPSAAYVSRQIAITVNLTAKRAK